MKWKEKTQKMKKNYLFWKRFLYILLSVIALICFSPLFLFTFIVDLVGENKGPLFYKQTRIGYHHKPFKIYKFRSMVVNAEEVLKSDPKLYQEYVKNNYKLEHDPRITKFGGWLRKTSLDEIPQFINILQGNMTLIGPRQL